MFELGIKVNLLLDTGYYTVDVINYLNANGINFIMRAVGKFKEGDDLIYTTSSERKRPEEQATFRIVAVKGRKRWAIETSYRMINQFCQRQRQSFTA